MAILWVNSGFEQEFDRKIGTYTEKVQTITESYEKAMKHIEHYSDRDSRDCGIYLKKRISALKQVQKRAQQIKKSAAEYVDFTIATDQKVARTIHIKSYDFYQEKHIGPQKDTWGARAWNAFKTTAEDFFREPARTLHQKADDVKEFYRRYKYIFNVVLDVLEIVGAISVFMTVALGAFVTGGIGAFGVICLLGAFWTLGKVVYETDKDMQAIYEHYVQEDEAEAERLSEDTLSGDILSAGEILDKKFGTHYIKRSTKIVLSGMEIAAFVGGMVAVFDHVKSVFHLQDIKSLDLMHCGSQTWKQNAYHLKRIKWGRTKNIDRFADLKNWAKFAAYNIGLSEGFKIKRRYRTRKIEGLIDTIKENYKFIEELKKGKIHNPIMDLVEDISKPIADIIMA